MILERYIFRSYIGPFFFSMSIITFVFIMDFIIQHIELLMEKGVEFFVVLQVFIFSLGHMFALIIPMAVLPTVLMSFGKLASENEITAMKANGINLYRMILPGVVAATLLTAGLIYYNSDVLPESNHALMNLLIDINRKNPTVKLEPNQRIDDFKGHTIYFQEKNDKTGEIKNVQIVKHAAKGVYPTTINAESGHFEFLKSKNVLCFDLVNGEIHELPVRGDLATYRRTKFGNYTINIKDVDRSLQRTGRQYRGDREMSVEMMREKIDGIYADMELADAKILKSANSRMRATLALLQRETREKQFGPARVDSSESAAVETGGKVRDTRNAQPVSLQQTGSKGLKSGSGNNRTEFITNQEIKTQVHTKQSYLRQIARYRVEIHKKYSIPFACIVFVLVGSPIAIRLGKSGMTTAIGLSIVVFLVYYICLIGGEKLADRGIVTAAVAMWSPNIIFGVFAIILLTQTAKERNVVEWDFSYFFRKFRRNAYTNTR